MQAQELVDSFDPRTLPAGLYVAKATDLAYGILDAMIAAGDAVFRGERWDAVGVKWRAAEVTGRHGMRPNQQAGSIRIGPEFFASAVKDYEDWQEKWWREAVQNAVDAGAANVTCTVLEQPDGTWLIACEDDGGGMDEDVLLNKFLVLGATTKVAAGGKTGGFGKAKELLVLPWLSWEIHTRDRVVKGAGIDYQVDHAPHLNGTKLTVVMPADKRTTDAACLAFIGKCYLPQVNFHLYTAPTDERQSGRRGARADLDAGTALRQFEGATLYHSKVTAFDQRLLVRANGIYMFGIWVADGVEGQLVVELTKPSIEMLTANRDGFRDYQLRRQVERFVSELAADKKSALRKEKNLIRRKYEGTGKFHAEAAERVQAAALESLGTVDPLERGIFLSDGQRNVVVEIIRTLGGGQHADEEEGSRDAGRGINLRTTGELAGAMLDGVAMRGTSHIEAAVKQLAWEPAFYLINEYEGVTRPMLKKFSPESMAPGMRKLAKFWAEVCRFVLIQLGSDSHYGVGFAFDPNGLAFYMYEDSEHWLLLNPIRKGSSPVSGEPYSLSEDDDVALLYAMAVHECTHMADGLTYHDESFAAALTRNMARTYGKDRQIEKIRKAVVARGPRKGGGERKPKLRESKTGGLRGYTDQLPGGYPDENVVDINGGPEPYPWYTALLTDRNRNHRYLEVAYVPRGDYGGVEIVRLDLGQADANHAFGPNVSAILRRLDLDPLDGEYEISRYIRKKMSAAAGGGADLVYDELRSWPEATWGNWPRNKLVDRWQWSGPPWEQ